jgi:pSer/pThr/pTyr-binding forkhead associated (FHA) protein
MEGIMSPRTLTVTLTLANGPRARLAYEFPELGNYVVGRAEECHPRLPNELPYMDVSRRHCLVSLHRSEVWVLDLHSKNGTYVNGEQVGKLTCFDPLPEGRQPPAAVPGAAHGYPANWHALKDGDVLALGHHTVLRGAVQVGQPVEA